MALTIPTKAATSTPPETASASSVKPSVATVAAAAPGGSSTASRIAGARIAPAPSAPLDAAFGPDIVVTADIRFYDGWQQKGSNSWIKRAVTPSELDDITSRGMSRQEYNTLLNSLYRPQTEQSLAARFDKGSRNDWAPMQAAMTPAEREKAVQGQMTPVEAYGVYLRVNPDAYGGAPPERFTPTMPFPRRVDD